MTEVERTKKDQCRPKVAFTLVCFRYRMKCFSFKWTIYCTSEKQSQFTQYCLKRMIRDHLHTGLAYILPRDLTKQGKQQSTVVQKTCQREIVDSRAFVFKSINCLYQRFSILVLSLHYSAHFTCFSFLKIFFTSLLFTSLYSQLDCFNWALSALQSIFHHELILKGANVTFK